MTYSAETANGGIGFDSDYGQGADDFEKSFQAKQQAAARPVGVSVAAQTTAVKLPEVSATTQALMDAFNTPPAVRI